MKLNENTFFYSIAIILISIILCKAIIDKVSKHKEGIEPLHQGNVQINSFKISQCITNCTEKGKLSQLEIIKDTLYLSFSHWFNCAGVAEINANLQNDTLFIETRGGAFIENIDEDTLRIYRNADCDCLFNLSCKITRLTKKPSVIRINDEEIENYLGPLAAD
jgi:hypothetical protein